MEAKLCLNQFVLVEGHIDTQDMYSIFPHLPEGGIPLHTDCNSMSDSEAGTENSSVPPLGLWALLDPLVVGQDFVFGSFPLW